MAEEMYNASEFSGVTNTLIQDFINYGDELSSLNGLNEKFFCGKPSAINSPVLGKNLFDLWEDNIKENLGSFIDAYNGWIEQLKAEGKVLEDYTRNQVDLFSKAELAEDAFNNKISDMQTINSTGNEQPLSSSIVGVPGLSTEETTTWSKASNSEIKTVENMFNKGIDINRITDTKQKTLYGVVGAKYVQDKKIELTNNGEDNIVKGLSEYLNPKNDEKVYYTKGEVDQLINDLRNQETAE